MSKRARLAEPIKDEFVGEDYVSVLPDHILVTILSRLTLKEAAVTSILSRRWRYLWTHVTELNFDADDAMNNIAADHELMNSERSKYINWVNRVFRQHRGPVDGVRICFDLDKSSKRAVDYWVKSAIVRRVQRLELNLLEIWKKPRLDNYNFPYKLLSRSKGMSLNNVCSNYGLMQPGMPSCLEVLKLKYVNVGEEALDCLFSNCPGLNYLSIHDSLDLKNVKVSGLTLKLKYLEIVFCNEIETIEISNVNLVSFAYLGPDIDLIICNVPMLDEISIGEEYYGLETIFKQLSCCLYQLRVLTLDIHCPEKNMKAIHFPVLSNLKELILKVGAWNDQSLLEFTSLITASPNLNRFVLQLFWMSPSNVRRNVRKLAKRKHEYLKSVEISGYYGRTSDAEVAMFFIENAVALEKIVIDPRTQRLDRSPVGLAQIKNEECARRRAREQLESKIPPGVQLIIL